MQSHTHTHADKLCNKLKWGQWRGRGVEGLGGGFGKVGLKEGEISHLLTLQQPLYQAVHIQIEVAHFSAAKLFFYWPRFVVVASCSRIPIGIFGATTTRTHTQAHTHAQRRPLAYKLVLYAIVNNKLCLIQIVVIFFSLFWSFSYLPQKAISLYALFFSY